MSIISSLTTLNDTLILIRSSIFLSGMIILFFLYRVLLISAPFIKQNKILFLVPIDAFFLLPEHALQVFQYYFSINVIIAKVGILPAIWSPLAIALMDISGLVILLLRIYSYWQEHKAGKNTKF